MTLENKPAELFKALALAQERSRAVEKGARNAFHNYRYASAEAIITEAKAALATTGLSIVPLGGSISGPFDYPVEVKERVNKKTGEVLAAASTRVLKHWSLKNVFRLAHSSGESVDLEKDWPVILEAGRPLDKAVAGAATTALSYLLRDLLLLPRVAEGDDMDHNSRDVERETQAPRESSPPPPSQEEDALVAELLELAAKIPGKLQRVQPWLAKRRSFGTLLGAKQKLLADVSAQQRPLAPVAAATAAAVGLPPLSSSGASSTPARPAPSAPTEPQPARGREVRYERDADFPPDEVDDGFFGDEAPPHLGDPA